MGRALVIGGAGDLGELICGDLLAHRHVRVLDVKKGGSRAGVEYIEGSALDYETVLAAAEDCDSILFLAMGPKNPDVWEQPQNAAKQFEIATSGVYLALRAAEARGIRKFVYASSLSVFGGFGQVPADSGGQIVPDATHFYGLAKRLGEEVVRALSDQTGMCSWALRLAFPMADDAFLASNDRLIQASGTAASDVVRALDLALQSSLEGFNAVSISSDRTGYYADLRDSESLLGWLPRIVHPLVALKKADR